MSHYAYAAALYVKAYCRMTFKKPERMESTVLQGLQLDCFDIASTGSHKYIPKDKLNKDLGLPDGAGVFGYVKMSDGSYMLLTCPGPLGVWNGKEDETARFISTNRELI